MNTISNLLLNTSFDEQRCIAERISRLRQEILHLTQEQFASSLDISQTYLSQIESGKKSITTTIIRKISSAFDVCPEWLLIGNDDASVFFTDEEVRLHRKYMEQEEALRSLCTAYCLQKESCDFLAWFLNLPEKERIGVQQAVSFFRKLD